MDSSPCRTNRVWALTLNDDVVKQHLLSRATSSRRPNGTMKNLRIVCSRKLWRCSERFYKSWLTSSSERSRTRMSGPAACNSSQGVTPVAVAMA